MIEKIEINALKSILNVSIPCKKLNLITGTNSSGKSTFLQAILVFAQTHYYTDKFSVAKGLIGLNGPLISLGEFRENKCSNSLASSINIKLEFEGNQKCYEIIISENEVKELKNGTHFDFFSELEKFNKLRKKRVGKKYKKALTSSRLGEFLSYKIIYISCNRIGAKDIYDKNYISDKIDDIGTHAIHYLEKHRDMRLDESLIKDEVGSRTLFAQVNYWLRYILDTTIVTENIDGTDFVKASYIIGEYKPARPKNVGAGVSYLISIIIACLSSMEDDVLIIENPEIHLHPKAQSKLTEFLYFIASSGSRQLFVETHSDHIFNGVRAGLSTSDFEANLINTFYFELDSDYLTKVTKVEIGKNGRILNDVPGLFDQFNLDLNKMLGIKDIL